MEEVNKKEKSWLVTILLCFFLGVFGIHRFYTGKNKSAIIQLITLGGVGIWTFVDLIVIANQKFQDINGNEIRENNKKNLNIVIIIFMIVAIINTYTIINGINNLDKLEKNVNDYNQLANSIDANMQVFIDTSASLAEEQELKNELNKIKGIAAIDYISKEMASQEMQEKFEGKITLNKELFPASYRITISDISRANEIYNKILLLDNVNQVNNGYSEIEKINSTTKIVNSYDDIAIFAIIFRVIEVFVIVLAIFIVNKNKKILSEVSKI